MTAENAIILCLAAVPITATDIREKRIPDLYSLGGLAFVLAFTIAFGRDPFRAFFVPALTGFCVFFLLRVVTGRKLGLGDVKYSALIAAALGVQGWLAAVFIAAWTALGFALVMLLLRKTDRKTRIAFGPFLSAGAVGSMFLSLTGAGGILG